MTWAVSLETIGVRIGGRAVLSDITLQVGAGEVVGVVGANGSGKTTLLRAALGLARLHEGSASLAGRSVKSLSAVERAALAGYLPQDRPVGWNMAAVDIAALGAVGRPPAEARVLARRALAEVGLIDLADRGILDMSGGERARVLLARLLVTRAPLLVADEPTAGLDPSAQFTALDLLAARAAAGAAVLVSLHDLTLAARRCDRLAVLAGGRLLALGRPREALSKAVLAEGFDLEGGLLETDAGLVVAATRKSTPRSGVEESIA